MYEYSFFDRFGDYGRKTGQGYCAVTFGIGVGISGIEGVGKPIKYSSTGTPPLTRFSYSAVFYLMRFFDHQNRVIFLSNTGFSMAKGQKKVSKIFFFRFLPAISFFASF